MSSLVPVVLYHHPHCSKSCRALDLIRSQGLEPTIVMLLESPPSLIELRILLRRLKRRAYDMVRKQESRHHVLGLDPFTPEDVVLRALHDNPDLIQRPIVMCGETAIVADAPESVLPLLEGATS